MICPKCRKEIPDIAVFCPKCGCEVEKELPDGKPIRSRSRSGSAAKNKLKKIYVAAAAAVFALVVVLLLISAPGTGNTERTDDDPGFGKARLSRKLDSEELQRKYRELADGISEGTEDGGKGREYLLGLDRGVIDDFDNDGYPEMLLLYSPDGREVHCLIARADKGGRVVSEDRVLGETGKTAEFTVSTGYLDGEPLVHLLYTDWIDGSVTEDTVFSLADGEIRERCSMKYFTPQNGGIGSFTFILNGEESDDTTLAGIYKASASYKQCVYGGTGTLLTELFPAEDSK